MVANMDFHSWRIYENLPSFLAYFNQDHVVDDAPLQVISDQKHLYEKSTE